MNCQNFQSQLPDFLLDPSAAENPVIFAHLRVCPPCERVYLDFQATFGLLDSWEAPEPSPYFDQKLAVRLREAQTAPAMSWFERLQTRLLFNTGRQFRPAIAGALALILLVGGGTVAELNLTLQPAAVPMSAAVDDLQILDRNEKAFQQMDQLLQDDDGGSSNSTQPVQNNQPIG
jgi:hypothetical protein